MNEILESGKFVIFMDGLDEIRLPNKAKVLQDYVRKLQTRIK